MQQTHHITLPLSKAAEIAYKSIRLRLGRSLLVTSGIALGIAFLVSVRTSELIERGLQSSGASADVQLRTRWVLAIALLVAFVGIVNAMLMSVTERFREIGTMKCLGALDGFVLKLFLFESLLQGIAGSIAGIAIGVIVSVISAWSSHGAAAIRSAPWWSILLSMLLALAIGVGLTVAAGIFPAWRAARLQPIEAMRVET